MRRPISAEIPSLVFGLTDKNVQFRNIWRWIALGTIWFILSGITMALASLGLQERLHVAIVIGLSFIKYIPLLIVVYDLARKMAARYLDDIYELNNEELASDFLEEVTFGQGSEKITINEGKITEKDEKSSLILIGGPGSIQVNLDSVALIERVDGEPQVIHPRNESWKLGRFERIREIGKYDEVGKREYAIINSRDQFVTELSIKSRTKDGMPIEARGIKVMFSILRKQENYNLPDEQAVQALVYNQMIITPESVKQPGISFPWDTTVIPLVISELEKLIMSRTLSEILATISQVEVDNAASNDQTLMQMKMEVTGQQNIEGVRKESRAPKFMSRTEITKQFFEKPFRDKAAKLGVSVQWIDIGTWQLPNNLILEKHKEAWELSQKNAKKRSEVERSRKYYEMEEIVKLVKSVVIDNYEKQDSKNIKDTKNKEMEEWEKILFDRNPDLKNFAQRETTKRDTSVIALDMLNAFRKELRAAKDSIQSENELNTEQQEELDKIEKALYDITYLTSHWLKKPS